MTSPSPSEFLTFYRWAVVTGPRLLRSSQTVARPSPRFFAVSACRTKGFNMLPNDERNEHNEHKEHSVKKVKKGDHYDIQSSNAKAGMDSAHKSGSGGHATERSDSAGGKAKAKKEHPEAPDVAIGMQDERGGRGG